MNSEIDDVRERISALLAQLPGEAELAELPAHSDLNALAQRLEEAHEVLVRALESVEKG
jgi:Tfp pilus assembly protein PilO